ncbi:VOC family protein [Streptosporangium sp. 'caverna']|uniref:VOC family protein n=1 Tax=Streptosporangium sp. 'caverna' TaxID=2202249 RepID=UPI0013A6DC59|nr:VOC family protein [Streptosporangium sp. 'caverna']
MDIDNRELGTPSRVGLQSPDPDAAARFYATLFGWEFGDTSPEANGYRTALLRERPAAGVGSIREPGRPGWTAYAAVADVDEVASKVTAAGGTILSRSGDASIVGPEDASGAGREIVFADPSGARFAVWQAGDRKGAAAVNEPGTFSWAELISDDVDSSAAFYGSVFGWTVTGPEGPMNRREWRLDGRSIAGLLPRPPAMAKDIPPYWDVYFTVADAAATAETAVNAGGTQLMPPTDIGAGHIAVFLDPAGAVFTVMAPKS